MKSSNEVWLLRIETVARLYMLRRANRKLVDKHTKQLDVRWTSTPPTAAAAIGTASVVSSTSVVPFRPRRMLPILSGLSATCIVWDEITVRQIMPLAERKFYPTCDQLSAVLVNMYFVTIYSKFISEGPLRFTKNFVIHISKFRSGITHII